MGCEKDSAEHLRSAERAWDEFAATQDCAPAPGEYSSVDDVKRFAAFDDAVAQAGVPRAA